VFWDVKLSLPDSDTSWKTRILRSSTATLSRSLQAQSKLLNHQHFLTLIAKQRVMTFCHIRICVSCYCIMTVS